MQLIDQINTSGLYAQYAASANKDSNGNVIVDTYATKSEIPSTDGLMEESKLTVEDGKITQYDGTPFAGGGGMSTVHTSEPIIGDGSEANPISANTVEVNYQQIVHDDSLMHVSNNAQYALGVNVEYLKWVMGVDETVLFDSKTETFTPVSSFSLSEPLSGFDRVRIEGLAYSYSPCTYETYVRETATRLPVYFRCYKAGDDTNAIFTRCGRYGTTNGKDYSFIDGHFEYQSLTSTAGWGQRTEAPNIYRVVGIHRKTWNEGN